METFNSFASIVPEPSVSNKSNASRISCFCSSVNPVEDEDEVVPFFAFNREREREDEKTFWGQFIYTHTQTNINAINRSSVLSFARDTNTRTKDITF
jgi:hypothetical protein